MAINFNYIDAFLAKVEGPCQRRGYVPATRIRDGKGRNYIGAPGLAALGVPYAACGRPSEYKAMGASGVTIATGCDLGQTDAKTLAAYGLRQEVIDLYMPYFGKHKAAALALLEDLPLEVGEATALATDAAVHAGYLRRYVAPAYEKASGISYGDLPVQAQAVIMSCCFQKGCAGVRRDWPKLWARLVSRDWQGAARELCTGFTQYRERRAAEGRLLAEI